MLRNVDILLFALCLGVPFILFLGTTCSQNVLPDNSDGVSAHSITRTFLEKTYTSLISLSTEACVALWHASPNTSFAAWLLACRCLERSQTFWMMTLSLYEALYCIIKTRSIDDVPRLYHGVCDIASSLWMCNWDLSRIYFWILDPSHLCWWELSYSPIQERAGPNRWWPAVVLDLGG